MPQLCAAAHRSQRCGQPRSPTSAFASEPTGILPVIPVVVCFYLTDSDWNNGKPTAAYQDVTSSYQDLGSNSRGANKIRNTRNDDRVYLRYYDQYGVTYYTCLKPNQTSNFSSNATVTGVRIDTNSTCPSS